MTVYVLRIELSNLCNEKQKSQLHDFVNSFCLNYSKMSFRQLCRTLLVPAATLVAEDKSQQDKQKSHLCRPSDLPIYVKDPPPPAPIEEPPVGIPKTLEDGFASVRQSVTGVFKEIKAYQRVGMEYLEQSRDGAEWLIKYLREEDNTTPKAGAIVIGGLTGLIFGLRGRFIKRTLYTATGALTMAAVCYPKEASEYTQTGLTEAKKYATIAYNFAYGVKKDDPPLELPSLPSFPTSLEEAWETVTKSASSLVSGGGTEQVTDNENNSGETTTGDVQLDGFGIVAKAHDESASANCQCGDVTRHVERNECHSDNC